MRHRSLMRTATRTAKPQSRVANRAKPVTQKRRLRRRQAKQVPQFDLLIYVASFVFLFTQLAHGGGPKYVAGVSFFDPAVKGNAVLWTQSPIPYYTDQGSLNPFVAQAD